MMHQHMLQWRRELHQIPELGLDCYKTHDYVKTQLEAMGYEPITMAKTGLVAFKQGKVDTCIAFRADMDGLPIPEQLELEYKSTHPGQMHACGHDGHMSMVLACADYCKDKEFHHSILFIFQPAEEGPGGAQILIEEGLFERFSVKALFGLHVYPELEEAVFALFDGRMMAQTNEFDVRIEGKAAHGAQPHRGVDAILIQAEFIMGIQALVSRLNNPLEPLVITVGKLSGGEARNIIAPSVNMLGTIRCFHPDVFEQVKTHLSKLCQSLELRYDAKLQLIFKGSYPPVINPTELYTRVNGLLNEEQKRIMDPMMFAEDFSFYQRKVPAFFAMMGSRNEAKDYVYPLHHDRFNFDETILNHGLQYYINIIQSFEAEENF
jgi:amidohydrolase